MKCKCNLTNNPEDGWTDFFKFEPQGFQKYIGQIVINATVMIIQDYTEKYLILTLVLQRNTKG